MHPKLKYITSNQRNVSAMKKITIVVTILLAGRLFAQDSDPGLRMAATTMHLWKDSFALDGKPARWSYDMGVVLKGFEGLWLRTGDATYYNYIQHLMDFYIADDGSIHDYKPGEYNIDYINNGKLALLLYRVTLKDKYLKAANLLREQLRNQPRTHEGGFWHKNIYPWQMWLDGLYMAQPFYAEYANLAGEDSAFNDIANQFVWMEAHARDPKTGLLYHGWDESKQQAWADKLTGHSPLSWSRAMGWYGCALVDVLDWFPKDHPRRKELLGILNRLVAAVAKVQQPANGLWYDIPDAPKGNGNYFEASAANMFVYTIAKAVRLGYIPATYLPVAKKGWAGILKTFLREENGSLQFDGTVKVSGLGGNPYRDGSFDYYMREPVVTNDPKGIGSFLMASNEMSMVPLQQLGKGKQVLLDWYFNNEYRKNAFGAMERFHYTWEDEANSGYTILGAIFRQYGATTTSLPGAPAASALKNASIYIIVDPDTEKETANPHYMNETDAIAIYNWVKAGGVLVLLSNDSGNAEFAHFNMLSEKFGIHFNENSINRVQHDQFETGTFYFTPADAIFKNARKVYIKELSTLALKPPATAHFKNAAGDVIIATAKIGKGTVFAVGDPWFYNEYADGRKLPATYENFTAATDLVKWLLHQATPKK